MSAVLKMEVVKPRRVLNVGGGGNRALPPEYEGWDQQILDIDETCKPDVVLDAKNMTTLPAGEYDAVFCSHNLEHFYAHDVPVVLKGMLHVLKDGGHAHISVPSFDGMIRALQANRMDVNDVWYRTSSGAAITFHDVLYGWSHAMEAGNLYYAHKCAFTQHSLGKVLLESGFARVELGEDSFNLVARAHKGAKCQ